MRKSRFIFNSHHCRPSAISCRMEFRSRRGSLTPKIVSCCGFYLSSRGWPDPALKEAAGCAMYDPILRVDTTSLVFYRLINKVYKLHSSATSSYYIAWISHDRPNRECYKWPYQSDVWTELRCQSACVTYLIFKEVEKSRTVYGKNAWNMVAHIDKTGAISRWPILIFYV